MMIYWIFLFIVFYYLFAIDDGRRNMSMIVNDKIDFLTNNNSATWNPVNYRDWTTLFNANYSISRESVYQIYL